MTAVSDVRRAAAFLDSLQQDPFEHVRRASEEHRESHAVRLQGGAQECGVYPSDPLKMRVLANIVRAMRAKRLLEIGCGLGYSALWLADAAGPDGSIETIDRVPEHAELASGFAKETGLTSRMSVLTGDSDTVLGGLSGPYDFIHDDGWFAVKPRHFGRLLELLRPGGVLACQTGSSSSSPWPRSRAWTGASLRARTGGRKFRRSLASWPQSAVSKWPG